MAGEGLNRYSWPYGHPINTQFDVNWDSPQARGLVAWWPMLGGQGGWPVLDRAFQRYPMAPFNTPTWASDGERGWSVLFDDGASEYLEINQAIVSNVPVTIAAWFNVDVATGWRTLVSIADTAVDDELLVLYLNNDDVTMRSSGSQAKATAGFLTTGVWHHACGIAGADDSRDAFLNGGNKGSNANNDPVASLDTTAIGRWVQATPHSYLSGSIADVRIYNRALSDGEVYQLYANPWELYRPRIPRQLVYVAPAARIPRYGFTNYQIPGIV